jgi:signal transduction histidine kinase/ligand-binding sensor domain-containing protein/DNA-binding response OmpR family regulator
MCLRIFFVLMMTVACCNVIAQQAKYQFRRLDVNDGLSHNQVTAFLKDRKGFLWIGSASGLNRFDGYTVRQFVNDPDDSTSISNNSVGEIFEMPDGKLGIFTGKDLNVYDPNTESFTADLTAFRSNYHLPQSTIVHVRHDHRHNIWFLNEKAGLIRYNVEEKRTFIYTHGVDASSMHSDDVAGYVHTGAEDWVIFRDGVLQRFEFTGPNLKINYTTDFLKKLNNGKNLSYWIEADNDGDLWIYVRNDPNGIYFFDHQTKQFHHFGQKSVGGKLNTDFVSGVVPGDDGNMWVSTDHGGLNIIDKKTLAVNYLLHHSEDEKSISQNSINTIYRDNDGIIWLGTFKKGASYYHENLIRFPLYKHYPLSTDGLPFGDVNRFIEDEFNNLWIGTNGGGLIYFDRKKNTYKRFVHDTNDPASISSNVVVSLCIDHEKKLWIGTYYGGLNMYDGKTFKHFRHDPADPESISDENVWEIFEDSRKRLWVGTISGGLNLYDRVTRSFSHYKQSDVNSVGSNYIASITEDKNGNLWFGTAEGADMLERATGRFFHYSGDRTKKGNLSDNLVYDIKEDSRGRIWLATPNGLNLFNSDSKTFTHFRDKQGLPHNNILTILEDNEQGLWLGTSNGLSNLRTIEKDGVTTYQFKNYDESDGLQGKQFNENAALKTRAGELIFGGADGFNIFDPSRFRANKNPPQVVLSDFKLYNKSVKAGEEINGDVLLKRSIPEIDEITLSPGQDIFSIEFAGLNFFNPEKNQYEYKLEGLQKEWLKVNADVRSVTFTNLRPGEYNFIVKASNNDGFWNDTGASVKINVLPPFWKTKTAFVLYFIFIITALLITRKLIQKRERLKFSREQERKEAIRMHELDMMKIRFFTNVSHEFRTPLTLILTPLEKMLRQAKEPAQQQQYQLIQRNARRLLNLVNQLLDFRKLEVEDLRLNACEGDIIRFIEETVYSFSDVSEKEEIKLSFHSSVSSLETIFDQDKLEKIIFNLLSNAFKFTPEHGTVTVDADIKFVGTGKLLEIKVRDTGIGIPAGQVGKVFDRFFQSAMPKEVVNQGSGIGLSITKEFVKLHGGDIAVESQMGLGTCFTVTIPVIDVLHAHHDSDVSVTAGEDNHSDRKKPLLLLVEDNEDFRHYLKDNLKNEFRIAEARNGNEGWKLAIEVLPDLIVSDIMMPEMNGIELCKKIKEDHRVSHTPVILLTARSGEEQKLEGFERGADDYITKPFNFEILVSRIRNLVAKREKLHHAFSGQLDIRASELKITSLDEKFIQKAIKCVESHISDADFSVEELSRELGISRAHFYKKIMSLTGKSPLELIRLIRLQQAAQLLKKSQLTVAEVAYQVGFNNPKYFARYFKEVYKTLPSLYATESKKEVKDK